MTTLTVRNEGLATFIELEAKVKPSLTHAGFQFQLPEPTEHSSNADEQLAKWQMSYANSAVQQVIEIYIANSKAKRSLARTKSFSE